MLAGVFFSTYETVLAEFSDMSCLTETLSHCPEEVAHVDSFFLLLFTGVEKLLPTDWSQRQQTLVEKKRDNASVSKK